MRTQKIIVNTEEKEVRVFPSFDFGQVGEELHFETNVYIHVPDSKDSNLNTIYLNSVRKKYIKSDYNSAYEDFVNSCLMMVRYGKPMHNFIDIDSYIVDVEVDNFNLWKYA